VQCGVVALLVFRNLIISQHCYCLINIVRVFTQ